MNSREGKTVNSRRILQAKRVKAVGGGDHEGRRGMVGGGDTYDGPASGKWRGLKEERSMGRG